MPRRTKTTNTDSAATAAKKTATKATKSTKSKKVEEVAAPAKVEAVVETPVEVTKEQELSSEFTNILSVIGTL